VSSSVDTEKRPGGKRSKGWLERARLSTEKATAPPDMEGLSSTLKRGATYSAAALLFGQLISFVQTLVLARLLGPDDMGIYVAGALLSGFLISVSEGGLRGALIQRENDVPKAANTVFWATGGTGMLLAVVALGTAPLVGMVSGFANPDFVATVTAIAAANSGVMIIHALTNVPDGLMQRQFNFRRRLIVDPARMLMFAVVSVTFAAMGYGPWAQVIGNYAAMLTWLGLSWWFAGWWPGFAKPSYRMWREMAKFAFPLMLEGLVEKVRTSIETILIGRGLDAAGVGNYRYGQRLSLIPGNAVVQIGSYVLFPAFSRLASDPDRLRNAFLRGLQWAWIASVAVAGIVVAIGAPAVVVLLGEEWRGAGLAFVALAGFGPGIALQAAGSEAIKATGRSQLLNWTTLTSVVLGLGLLFILLPPFGLVGVGLAASITELAVGAVILVLTYKVIPYPIPAMLRSIVPPLIIAAIAGAVTGFVEHEIVHSDRIGVLLGVLALAAESLLFMVIFLAGMAVVEPKLARRAVKAIRSKLRRGGDDDEDDDEDDGIERRDPILDPPTMLMPAFRADETMEFGRRMSRDWGSPTAQTMVLPVIRPRAPIRPGEETTRVAARPSEETTRVPARMAEADAAVDRAEDAIESGERIPVGSPMGSVDGPTEMALPARHAVAADDPPRAGNGAHTVRPTPGPREPDPRRPVPGPRGGAPDGFGRGGPSSLPPGAVPPFDGPPSAPPGAGRPYDSGAHSLPPGAVPPYDSGAHSLPPGVVPPFDGRAGGGARRPQGPPPQGAGPQGAGPQGAGQPGQGRSGPPQPGPRSAGPGQPGPVSPGPRPQGPPRPNPGQPNPGQPNPGQPNPGQQGPLPPGPYGPQGPGQPGPYRPSPRPQGDAEGGPRPAPQGPPGAGMNGGPGRPYGPGPDGPRANGAPSNGAPNGAPRNGVPNGAWPLNGDSGRHAVRQALPNGGRGPRPPTPPRGTEGPLGPPLPPPPRPLPPQSPSPQPSPPPHGPSTQGPSAHGPSAHGPSAQSPSPPPRPSPRRHRYLDDSGPQPVLDEPVAPEVPTRRHRYRDDEEDVPPADPTRESRLPDDERQERRPEDRPRPRPRH